MTWVKLDDCFADHRKVLAAGGDAAWLHVTALCYTARQLTNGFIPAAVVSRLSDRKNPAGLAQKLVEVGLWEPSEGGYQIHDYLEWNPSAEEVRQKRAELHEVKSRAGRAGAAKRWQADSKTDGRPIAAAMGPAIALPMAENGSRPDPDPDPVPEKKKKDPPSGPPAKRPRRTSFPDQFEPSETDLAVGREQGFDRDRIDAELAKFRSWHLAEGKLRADYHQAFQNWLRKSAEIDQQRPRPVAGPIPRQPGRWAGEVKEITGYIRGKDPRAQPPAAQLFKPKMEVS